MASVIVVAIDESRQAEAAFDWYLENIHRPGYSVVLVHCVDVTAISASGRGAEVGSERAWQQERSRIKALEDRYRWKLIDNGISGRIRTETGKPGEAVIKVTQEESAKLVVMGSRGLSAMKRVLIGSVSDYVLHHAHCPVIICR